MDTVGRFYMIRALDGGMILSGPTFSPCESFGARRAGMPLLASRYTVLIGVRDDGVLLGQEVADKTLQQLAHYRGEIEPAAAITTERL